jgi:hypothetical protein
VFLQTLVTEVHAGFASRLNTYKTFQHKHGACETIFGAMMPYEVLRQQDRTVNPTLAQTGRRAQNITTLGSAVRAFGMHPYHDIKTDLSASCQFDMRIFFYVWQAISLGYSLLPTAVVSESLEFCLYATIIAQVELVGLKGDFFKSCGPCAVFLLVIIECQ